MHIPSIGPQEPHYPAKLPLNGTAAFSVVLLSQLSQLIENKLLNN